MIAKQQKMIGESLSFLDLLDKVSLVAPLSRPILIVGERGTGKELIASRLHYLSSRWEYAYQQLNCAALNEGLIESELFGHEQGAFTGANKTHVGRFERAEGGTLFLDELATTSSRTQEKLLRVIEYGEFERLGGSKTISCDVRIVAATNVDLPALAAEGKFRADLLDRLAFDVLTLPPLRERREDIQLLSEHFATAMSRDLGREYFAGFSSEALERLLEHAWPGNVRELKNCIERSVYRHQNVDKELREISIDPFDSPFRLKASISDVSIAEQVDRKEEFEVDQKGLGDKKEELILPCDLKSELHSLEERLIEKALEKSHYKQKHAADLLGISYHQLRASLKKIKNINQFAD